MKSDRFKSLLVPQFGKKFLIMIIGIFLMGFFLSFLVEVDWGTDPYTFQNTVISTRLGWSLGTWQLCLNGVLFVLVIIFNRRLIGLGTLANMVLVGYTVDFFRWVWRTCFPLLGRICTEPGFLWAKIVVFVLGILCFVIAASLYMNADLGLSPYDGLAFIISRRLKGKISVAVSRIAYDLSAVLIGILVSLGTGISILTALIGSVAMALTLGPAIQIVGKFVNEKLLRIPSEKQGQEIS
ncbi:MAG: hypothetical protein II461_00480 [Treponema sp.]|nr:hypothetical protein [Treponema sp.]